MHNTPTATHNGIDLHEAEQLALLERFSHIDVEDFIQAMRKNETRYVYHNERYNICDGMLLHYMLRLLQPKQIVEIGSGLSSCITLDTNERYFDNSIHCTFIDIDMYMLYVYSTPKDIMENTVIERPVQEVDPSIFTALQEGDILFIDSSHIYEHGSDVQYLLNTVLPMLSDGVYIHIHDIFAGFAYPSEWTNSTWNEIDHVRLLLEQSNQYTVTLFISYMATLHENVIKKILPPYTHITQGGSLWIQKSKSYAETEY